MGNTFEIWCWTIKEDAEFGQHDAYHYVQYWRGESFLEAIDHLIKAKKEGFGCVKLEYR